MKDIHIAGGTLRLRWGFTLFVICGVLFLLGLGGWQLQRGAWKHALVANIENRMAAAAQDFPTQINDPAALDYVRVRVTGILHHDKELHLAARDVRHSLYGYQILTPLETPEQGWVLVNRGWVPAEKKTTDKRADGQIMGSVTITGVARLPKSRGWMMPDNSPTKNVWLWFDLAGMAQSAGVPALAPLVVEADATPNPGGWPRGGQTRVSFPDNHLTYAITWFALALALLVIGCLAQWRRTQDI